MKLRIAAVISLLIMLTSACFAGEPMKLEDLIAKHLASIGTPEARAAVKTRAVVGATQYHVVTGGSGTLEGKTQLACEGRNLRYVTRFNNTRYPGDDFTSNGDKTWVAANTSGRRHAYSKFVYELGPGLLRDGLIAGTLSTAWPLLDPKVRDAKLSFSGLKKIDGVELYEVKYVPKQKQDAEIKLYFDPTTFRHVRTIASASIDPKLVGGRRGDTLDFMSSGSLNMDGNGASRAQTAQQTQYYRFDQRFDDFQTTDGLTLPMKSTIRYSAEGYQAELLTYETKFEPVQNNIGLDAKTFAIK